jgi:Mg-chelatase subunit ChlD
MVGGAQQAFEVQPSPEATLLAGGQEDFGDLISRLKKDGLDVVIVFDSTKSMKGEIAQVKNRIERIGNVLMQLVPKTRIGICTYRDEGDEYLVKGLELTDNLTKVILYLEGIAADGGGDIPEAVHSGLKWAIEKNDFRNDARKVILLFGDAQPHPDESVLCRKLASDFRKMGGVVSTVTCRKQSTLPDFDAIAKIGGGESYLTQNEREIMSQLIVLVFGSRHRSKVLEAFDLLNR